MNIEIQYNKMYIGNVFLFNTQYLHQCAKNFITPKIKDCNNLIIFEVVLSVRKELRVNRFELKNNFRFLMLTYREKKMYYISIS